MGASGVPFGHHVGHFFDVFFGLRLGTPEEHQKQEKGTKGTLLRACLFMTVVRFHYILLAKGTPK